MSLGAPYDVAPRGPWPMSMLDKAVILLDKLRRTRLLPYATETTLLGISGDNATAPIPSEDLRNGTDDPFLLTRVALYHTSSLAAAAATAVGSHINIKLVDNDRHEHFSRDPVLMSTLVSPLDNHWTLDRPHVAAPGASFAMIVDPDMGILDPETLFLTLKGTIAYGGVLSATDVRAAIGLGIFPSYAGLGMAWGAPAVLRMLACEDYACTNVVAEQLRWQLLARILELRQKLSRARIRPLLLPNGEVDITQSRWTTLPSERNRNDSDYPFVVRSIQAWTGASRAASAAGNVFANVSLDVSISLDRTYKMTWRPILFPTFFGVGDPQWVFDYPIPLGNKEAFALRLIEENIAATTDAFLTVQGEVVEGDLTADDLREAIGLGIYGAWRRARY